MIKKFKEDIKVNGIHIEKLFILIIYRLGNYMYYSKVTKIIKVPILLILEIIRKIFVVLLFKIEIPFKCRIGEGLKLMHPHGIIIHSNVVIGKDCTIYHQVTIGSNDKGNVNEVASIGDNVYIGSGAKIIGNVLIKDNVKIGANSVVVKDVPKQCTVVGNSMKIILKNNN